MISGVWISNLSGACLQSPTLASGIADATVKLAEDIATRAPLTVVAFIFDADFNQSPKMQAAYTVGVGDKFGWRAHSAAQPLDIEGDRRSAESLVKYGIEQGFDFAKAEEISLNLTSLPIGRELAAQPGIRLVPIMLNPRIAPSRPIIRYRDLATIIEKFLLLQTQEPESFGVYAAGATSGPQGNKENTPGGTFDAAARNVAHIIESTGPNATLAAGNFQSDRDAAGAISWVMAECIGRGGPTAMIAYSNDERDCLFEAAEIRKSGGGD